MPFCSQPKTFSSQKKKKDGGKKKRQQNRGEGSICTDQLSIKHRGVPLQGGEEAQREQIDLFPPPPPAFRCHFGLITRRRCAGAAPPRTTFSPVVTPQNLPHRHRGIIHWVLIFQNPTGTNMQLYSSVVQRRIGSRGGDRATAPASAESFPA